MLEKNNIVTIISFGFFPPTMGKSFFGDSSWCREHLQKILLFSNFSQVLISFEVILSV